MSGPASLSVRVSISAIVHQSSSLVGSRLLTNRSGGFITGQVSVACSPEGMQSSACTRPAGRRKFSTGSPSWYVIMRSRTVRQETLVLEMSVIGLLSAFPNHVPTTS